MTAKTISETALAGIPQRRSREDVVVLKFGGTTVDATNEQVCIQRERHTIDVDNELGTNDTRDLRKGILGD